MSSDYITATQLSETTRLPVSRSVSRAAESQAITGDVQRKESAASGKELPPDKAGQQQDTAQVESAVSRISDFVQNFQRDLQFSVDKDSGRSVIKVIDSETNQVIRQIPSEESLRLARHLDSPASLILSEQA